MLLKYSYIKIHEEWMLKVNTSIHMQVRSQGDSLGAEEPHNFTKKVHYFV